MRELLSGNEAVAIGAIKAGVRFFAGYPITPSTEIAEYMARELPKIGGIFIQMEDEIASINAVIGAAASGMKAMTATSGPGFSLMQEGIGYACMAEIPCLIVNVQRGGPATGLPTKPAQADVMQTRWGTHGDHPIVVFYPYSVLESFLLTVKAINIAYFLRIPVILLTDEIIAHMREIVELPEVVEIYQPKKKKKGGEEFLLYSDETNYDAEVAYFGEGYRIHISGLTHREDGFPTNEPAIIKWKLDRLKRKIEDNKEKLWDLEYQDIGAEVCLISYGVSARVALEAKHIYEKKEKKALGYIRLKTLWPFPDQPLKSLLKSAKKIIVIEMNQGQLINEIERTISPSLEIVGVQRYDGEIITPEEILAAI